MNRTGEEHESTLGPQGILLASLGAIASFQLAYTFPACSFMFAGFLWCLVQLTRVKTLRQAVYAGLAIGLFSYGPQLSFFWTIFGPAAIALWFVPAFWLSLFLALGWSCRTRFGPIAAAVMIPFLWTGLEYFRGELYYLRFSWLNGGYVYSDNLAWLPFRLIGSYGIGFLTMTSVSLITLLPQRKSPVAVSGVLASLAILTNLPVSHTLPVAADVKSVRVAGVQMEFPSEAQVILNLNKTIKRHPDAEIVVLSEYTFNGPVPGRINAWCRDNQRYLVIGATDPAPDSQYYDTAFVIGPSGDVVFRQGKCVPIQFFKDGLPALEQKLWESPWGNIGICICYDLSYRRVTDQLIRLGAQAIIVPTMDVVDWGRHQHEMHARVAPLRAAEYGIPIFRLASSGISQCVNAGGRVLATAPMPGDEAMISSVLDLKASGTLPIDRILAPLSVGLTGLFIILTAFLSVTKGKKIIGAQPDKT